MIIDSIINNLQVRIGDFHEPIILKKDESLKNRLTYLESYRTEEDAKEIYALKKGIEGEDNVLYQLMHTGIGMYILHGIQIEDAQIDFVVVTRGWIYFIECKNWKGNWIIQNDGTILIKNGDNIKSPKSPFAQNQIHMNTVKQRWRKKRNKFTRILLDSLFEKNWYKPLVVVSNYESIIDNKDASEYDKTHIIRADQLPSYIKKDLETYSGHEPFSTKKNMKKIARSFLQADKECREKHIQQKREKAKPLNNARNWQQSQKQFRKNLLALRKHQSEVENKSEYEILTDREIDIILQHNYSDPKNLAEVRISQEKKEKYGRLIIAAYDDAFNG